MVAIAGRDEMELGVYFGLVWTDIYTATLRVAFTLANTTEHGKRKECRGEKRVHTACSLLLCG